MTVITRWVVALILSLSGGMAWADGERLPGKFVWAELVTHDMPAAQAFYSQLFDWEYSAVDGYETAWKGDEPVGGLVYHPKPKDKPGKSRWVAYISVENPAAARQAVVAAGAREVAAERSVPGLGELSVFADPEGALFGLIHSAGPDPEDYLADEGDWIWIQLFSRNAQQASQFYQRAGGYERFDNPDNPGSYLLVRGGYARAALSTISARYPDAQPAWIPFLRVASVPATLRQAATLGGKTLVAPRPDLYDNSIAIIEGPDGAAVGIMEWKQRVGEVAP